MNRYEIVVVWHGIDSEEFKNVERHEFMGDSESDVRKKGWRYCRLQERLTSKNGKRTRIYSLTEINPK